ncbi:MAG: hypothetical protein L0Z50_25410 [Verrucomicrobiales bacterium]|nr:hypothetical protein [Verrucomicrobiales bacterium]
MQRTQRFRKSLLLAVLAAAVAAVPFSVGAAPALIAGPTAEQVAAQGQISFTFNEPMSAADIDITWEGTGLDPAKFQCAWLDQIFGIPIPPILLQCTYTGGLPPGVEVRYTLNKGNSGRIKNAANQPLPETTGSFRTLGGGGGDPEPCEPSAGGSSGAITLMKEIHYRQTGSADPTFDSGEKAVIRAAVNSPTNSTVTVASASLRKPDGSVVELTKIAFDLPPPAPSLPPNFFLSTTPFPDIQFPTFDSEDALNSAYPPGAYSMTIAQLIGGTRTVNLPLNPAPAPPAPKNTNPDALANFDVTKPLTIQWGAFTGAGANDSVTLSISEASGDTTVFHAPDPCKNIQLRATDTAITVPANTFQSGVAYVADLTFGKVTHLGENTVQGFSEFAALLKTTRFTLGATGGSTGNNALTFTRIEILQTGAIKLVVEGGLTPPSVLGVIQGSANLQTWTDVTVIPKASLEAVGGKMDVLDILPSTTPTPQKFYRIICR